ncbi:hypothetical protein BJ166DRAFT_490977 [Pestalotiopsis sp. NC0098]|nr:hypothetical protein BJ166DRAFT_490977 [Pestalotiopsis sp. NC0098]
MGYAKTTTSLVTMIALELLPVKNSAVNGIQVSQGSSHTFELGCVCTLPCDDLAPGAWIDALLRCCRPKVIIISMTSQLREYATSWQNLPILVPSDSSAALRPLRNTGQLGVELNVYAMFVSCLRLPASKLSCTMQQIWMRVVGKSRDGTLTQRPSRVGDLCPTGGDSGMQDGDMERRQTDATAGLKKMARRHDGHLTLDSLWYME